MDDTGNKVIAIIVVVVLVLMCCCAIFLFADYLVVDWYCDHGNGIGHEIAKHIFRSTSIDCSKAVQVW